ncbi:MAG: RlpA-like double-psi beta-barrel domain-containing protein [Patescibacteria group bacterium]
MKIKLQKLITIGALFLFMAPSATFAASLNFATPSYNETATIVTSADTSNIPWEWQALSPVYSYSFSHPEMYDPSRPMTITINYDGQNNKYKQIFILDELSGIWQPLLTTDVSEKNYATAITTSTQGKLILLTKSDLLSVGTASWYKYKNGDFAASPDFAKGSILRVTNLANGKFVDVTVNDYGPERAKFPTRVVDLDKVAFAKIAATSDGLINVKVTPLKIVTPTINKSPAQFGAMPTLTASSAVIMLEKDGSIIWGKNETDVSPLASLTKLVALRVFLDRKPSLNQVVTYKVQDEKYNYLYVNPWESARLTVKDGETLTIGDLVYSALVGSANNAVESLVRVSGLSRPDFIKKMNEVVASWGATSTKFIEPTGLSPQNVSSPLDYAIIMKEVFTSPLLSKISTTARYTFKTINTKKTHTLNNTSKLVKAGDYPIIGSKTGFLNEAGNCLMTRVSSPQGNLIVVNFGSTSSAASFSDNEQMIRYGLLQLKK